MSWAGPVFIALLALFVIVVLFVPEADRCRYHAVPDGQGGYFLFDCKRGEATR